MKGISQLEFNDLLKGAEEMGKQRSMERAAGIRCKICSRKNDLCECKDLSPMSSTQIVKLVRGKIQTYTNELKRTSDQDTYQQLNGSLSVLQELLNDIITREKRS